MSSLCFSTLACPDWPMDEILTFAREHGYGAIEVRGLLRKLHATDIPEFQPENIEATREKLLSSGVRIACLSSSLEIQRSPIWNQVRESAFKHIDIAQKLDIPYVRVLADCAPSPMGQVDDFQVRFNARELGKYAQDMGVTILIENNGVYADSARMGALLDEIDMDSVGVLWDLNHPVRFFGEAPETTYQYLGKRIKHLHIKDSYMNANRVKYCTLGEGDLPLRHALRLFERWGYSGYYSLEWLRRWDSELEAPEKALTAYPVFMQSMFSRV